MLLASASVCNKLPVGNISVFCVVFLKILLRLGIGTGQMTMSVSTLGNQRQTPANNQQ